MPRYRRCGVLRRRTAYALPGSELGQLRLGLSRSSEPEVLAEAVGQCGQHPEITHRVRLLEDDVERPLPALPRDKGPGALLHHRDGQDDVGPFGHGRRPGLEADQEVDGLQTGDGGLRVEEVAGLDAGDDQRLQVTGGRRREHLLGVATGVSRKDPRTPGRLGVDSGCGIGHRATTGQQAGETAGVDRATLPRPPRDPRHPGAGAGGQSGDGTERAGQTSGAFADQDQRPGVEGDLGRAEVRVLVVQDRRLVTGRDRDQGRFDLASPVAEVGSQGPGPQTELAPGLAESQEDGAGLLLRLEGDQQDRAGRLQIGVGDSSPGARHVVGQEFGLLRAVVTGPEVDVVGAQDGPGELRVGVRILLRQPPARQNTGRAARCLQAADGHVDGLRPGGRTQHRRSGARRRDVADQRPGEPVVGPGVGEGEPVLVSDPLLVDLRVVARQSAHHQAATVVHPDGRAARVMLGDRRRGHQVERPGAEAVGRAGQRADGTDLNRVAGEVRVQRLLLVDADLLQRAPLDQRDEGVAGDLLGETGAPGTEHAALPVEQHVGRDVDRLGEGALEVGEAGLAVSVRHGLVLQRAFSALVADGAVERMVDQQELHVSVLSLVRDRRGQLGADLHPSRHLEGAGRLRLRDGAAVAPVRHLDQALPAGADRVQQRVVAEPGHIDPDQLGGPDDQCALRHRHLDVVDSERDQLCTVPLAHHAGSCRCIDARGGHALAP